MKDELWLKKIKARLEDYDEPLPLSSGWERLERELEQPVPVLVPRHRDNRRWWWAAAAVALLLLLPAGWWLYTPVSEEAGPADVPLLAQQTPVEEALPVKVEDEVPTRVQNSVHRVQELIVIVEEHVEIEEYSVQDGVQAPVQERVQEERQEAPRDVRPDVVKRKRTSLDVPAPPQRKKRGEGWSLALAMGGGSLNGATRSGGMADMVYASAGNLNELNATTSGMVASVPSGRKVVYVNGQPAIKEQQKQLVVTSTDHKQPLSFGLSVRKGLPYGLSVESGLMYTYLASDIRYQDGSSIKQKLHYVGVPLRLNWSFVERNGFNLYLSAGGAVEKCVYGKVGTEKYTVDPLQLSVMGAVGAQYNLSRRVGIYVEPGISYYFDDGDAVETIRKEHPGTFTLQAGIRLTY